MAEHINLIDDKKNGIIFRTFSGDISFTEIYTSWEHLISDYLLSYNCHYKGIINDISKGNLQMDIQKVKLLMELFRKHEHLFKKLKIAVLTLSPDSIVLPVYAAQYYPEIQIKAFSTMEAAVLWINYN